MDSIALNAPEGIDARLGWDPALPEHDRKRILAREIVGARLRVDPSAVKVERELPTVYGHHTRLIPTVEGRQPPLHIRDVSFRAATVVAVAGPEIQMGVDLRDPLPDAVALAAIRAHSRMWPGTSDHQYLEHWARVQAVLAADGRGRQVRPETVLLDGQHGWVPDRPIRYRIVDLSRNAFVITLAYAYVG